MSAQANIVQLPRLATWLVNLFISAEGEIDRRGLVRGILPFRFEIRSCVRPTLVLATVPENHQTSHRRWIPCSARVRHGRCDRRIFSARVRLEAAREATIGAYRPIPRVLVDPLRSLRVAPERNVRRAYRRVHVRWLYGRASGQG